MLARFADNALTRSEMKRVVGGINCVFIVQVQYENKGSSCGNPVNGNWSFSGSCAYSNSADCQSQANKMAKQYSKQWGTKVTAGC